VALSAATTRDPRVPGQREFLVAAGETIYQGSMVMIVSGYAKVGADTAGGRFAGIALKTVDNSAGSDGDKKVVVNMPDSFDCSASGAAQATWVGVKVYLVDDDTVALAATTTNDVLVGICEEVTSSTKVRVLPAVA